MSRVEIPQCSGPLPRRLLCYLSGATVTVPIVMAIVGDPVGSGIVASLARPGGNITGSSFFGPELGAKRIELLKEMLARITRVGVLSNPDNPYFRLEIPALEATARSLGIGVSQFPVRSPKEFESAFETMQQEGVKAVAVQDEAMLTANVTSIAALATRRSLLSIRNNELARAGGLIGYGVNFFEIFRRAAAFVDKVLKGTKPTDIPIEQATKFQFVLNLKTAKALDLVVPTSMLLRADEVIE
jgi:putative tryptophan/tyrosine transport system substrate-binding protein